MFKKWLSLLCMMIPALAALTAYAFADTVGPAGSDKSICASGQTLSGVDVSDKQNTQSWATTLQSGRQYAFVKATQGVTFVNPDFQRDWNGTIQAGVLRGAYHYFSASDDPDAQSQNYLRTIGTLGSGDLPPMLDWEQSGSIANALTIARAQTWLTDVEQATGRTPVIYTNPGYWKKLGYPAGFDRYPLFIADYGVPCPIVPAPWTGWTFWQHGIGMVPGIQNNTDLDTFNGSLADLMAL